MYNHFTWCEVSTLDLSEAKCFYEGVFRWEIEVTAENYSMCYSADEPSAGMIKMPSMFVERELPSFWLSFIHVDSLFDMVNLAVELGGKIVVHSADFVLDSKYLGKYTLIKDPSGVELILFEGNDLKAKDDVASSNAKMGNMEFHVDSVDSVRKFYEQLFGWKFAKCPDEYGRYLIADSKGGYVASLLEINSKTKGDKNYWMVNFSVDDVSSTLSLVKKYGGLVIIDVSDTSYGFAIVQDTQGAFFCVQGKGKLAS